MKKMQIWSLVFMHFPLLACAIGQSMINHSFSFDTIHDSPDIEVLDFQYGNSREFGTRAERERVQLGEVFPAWQISGALPRGDFLYVKWRIKQSQQVYEDKVDLTTRLPADIANFRVHFVIKGSQLYVYLISPWTDRRPASWPVGPVRMYAYLKQYQIYPDQPK